MLRERRGHADSIYVNLSKDKASSVVTKRSEVVWGQELGGVTEEGHRELLG